MSKSFVDINDSFGMHESLIKMTILDGVESIDDRAYEGWDDMTDVTLPNSLKSIGDYAFSDCTYLSSITIPDSVTYIGEGAFLDCWSLTSIKIGKGVTHIGNSAFAVCGQGAELTVDEENSTYHSMYNCLIETKSKTLVWANEKSVIPTNGSVENIGFGAFGNLLKLTSVEIPNSVTHIGECAFAGCIGLTSVTIPDSVTHIGECAFAGCAGLTSITIPNSVTFIGEDAFCDCDNLQTVYYNGTKEQWEALTFDMDDDYFKNAERNGNVKVVFCK